MEGILAAYGVTNGVGDILYRYEIASLQHFGYGVNGFTFAMLETAVEATSGKLAGADVLKIIGIARWMLDSPVQLFDKVEETLDGLAATHRLVLITKGELINQKNKVSRSGLAGYFQQIEIVNNKGVEDYQAILQQYGVEPSRFLMAGNSLKSDILPVLAMGGWAVYIPFLHTWAHEQETPPDPATPNYAELDHIGLMPAYIRSLEAGFQV
jgi:putative hydrolase of the HAD superfamily